MIELKLFLILNDDIKQQPFAEAASYSLKRSLKSKGYVNCVGCFTQSIKVEIRLVIPKRHVRKA